MEAGRTPSIGLSHHPVFCSTTLSAASTNLLQGGGRRAPSLLYPVSCSFWGLVVFFLLSVDFCSRGYLERVKKNSEYCTKKSVAGVTYLPFEKNAILVTQSAALGELRKKICPPSYQPAPPRHISDCPSHRSSPPMRRADPQTRQPGPAIHKPLDLW